MGHARSGRSPVANPSRCLSEVPVAPLCLMKPQPEVVGVTTWPGRDRRHGARCQDGQFRPDPVLQDVHDLLLQFRLCILLNRTNLPPLAGLRSKRAPIAPVTLRCRAADGRLSLSDRSGRPKHTSRATWLSFAPCEKRGLKDVRGVVVPGVGCQDPSSICLRARRRSLVRGRNR